MLHVGHVDAAGDGVGCDENFALIAAEFQQRAFSLRLAPVAVHLGASHTVIPLQRLRHPGCDAFLVDKDDRLFG